jgi:rod shape-determining protein MreC
LIRDTTASRVVLGSLLAGTLGLAVADSRSDAGPDSPLHSVRAFAARVFGPAESGLVQVTRPVAQAISGMGRTHELQQQLDAARAENLRLSDQLRTAAQSSAVVGEQAGLAPVARAAAVTVRPTHVIAVAPDPGYSWTVAIDTGTQDGVATDTAVVDAAGLVGRVTAAAVDSATVLLLIDPISSVGVRSETSGQIGTLTGTGDDLCRLVMFDPHVTPAVGEELRTFGSRDARPYAAGIPVGRVVSVTPAPGGTTILVRPYTAVGNLDALGVVVPSAGAATGITAAEADR